LVDFLREGKMTDEQITAMVARLRSNRPLPTLPHEAADLIEAQAAEIARLREAVERLDAGQNRGPVVTYKRGFGPCDGDNAILAQETQP
jgi:hypothetical protein